MNKVKILAEEVANRIAAGEVIERPVSVVKELVENSIDAQSTKISIYIEAGGKQLIQIIDNGYGMSKDDALQCFERHATSKICTVTDIFQIRTLGFRGEALPSIASVSSLTMVTREKESETAMRVEFKGGQLRDFSQTSSNVGTNIVVRDLFSNVPARKKFLKSEPVEYKHILDYLHYQSVVHPEIHFRFYSNGLEKLNYPVVESREKRLADIFGSDFLKKDLLKLAVSKDQFSISGYIGGLEDEYEGLFDFRYIFVNGRFIRDKIIVHSIRSAYEPFIKKLRIFQQGKIPPYLIFIEIEPEKVDFNVHPAKLEVRFIDSGLVHSFVKSAITNRLLEYEDKKFEQIKIKLQNPQAANNFNSTDPKQFLTKTDKNRLRNLKEDAEHNEQTDFFRNTFVENQEMLIKLDSKQKTDWLFRPEEDIINPWQLHQSYIFVQIEEGLIIIDQHAAHERILYEKMIHRIHGAPPQTQQLLFPLVIDLPPYLAQTVSELISQNMEVFHKVGFSLKSFSGNSIVIDEIPAELKNWDGGEVFIEILKNLQDEFSVTEDFRDSMAKSIACKTAVKAGEKLSKKEMITLINDLFACEIPYFCPHGRPLIIKMTLFDFEKKFKRTT
jgi:DNA mismatch repair protein MutL